MPRILEPARIPVPGGKLIDELIGRASTGGPGYSVARMQAPGGWSEPGQRPEFDEVTYVITGEVIIDYRAEGQNDGDGDGDADGDGDGDGDAGPSPASVRVGAGQSVLTRAGEWVRYSVGPAGAEYLAVCVPAFAPEIAHRDDEDPGATSQ